MVSLMECAIAPVRRNNEFEIFKHSTSVLPIVDISAPKSGCLLRLVVLPVNAENPNGRANHSPSWSCHRKVQGSVDSHISCSVTSSKDMAEHEGHLHLLEVIVKMKVPPSVESMDFRFPSLICWYIVRDFHLGNSHAIVFSFAVSKSLINLLL